MIDTTTSVTKANNRPPTFFSYVRQSFPSHSRCQSSSSFRVAEHMFFWILILVMSAI